MLKYLLLFLPFLNFAQEQRINIIIDPHSSYKEKGLNIGIEGELVDDYFYTKIGVQHFSVLKGKYTDLITTVGVNKLIDKSRFYGGAKFGTIFRESNNYFSHGLEFGYDYTLTKHVGVGLRSSLDYRSDFKYWKTQPKYRPSSFIKLFYRI